ncbi:MAG: LacI family DNA-binding transcriptional regulator [Candidatus Pristimantibacillus sp.]
MEIITTIKDVAKKLGVSVSTVSRAMNDHPDIRTETKQEVLEAMRELNYTPNAVARSLIQRKSYSIGLMMPDITDPFLSAMAQGIEEILSDKGYQVVYGNTTRMREKEESFLLSAAQRKMDGLIVTSDYMDADMIQLLRNLEIPIVFLRRRPPAELEMPFVDVDHYQGSCRAVEYLLSLNHKQIGFIGMPEFSYTGQERYRAYCDTMNKHQISVPSVATVFADRSYASGYQAMEQLYSAYPSMTAVFAANDILAIGALEWLAKQNIAVPDQISIVGFDNLEVSDLHWIKLTTVAQPRKEMGKKAAELLMSMVENKGSKQSSLLFDTELVIRRTCTSI